MAECVARPPDLDVALQWYKYAAANPAWKATAERKAELLGQWCPGRPGCALYRPHYSPLHTGFGAGVTLMP